MTLKIEDAIEEIERALAGNKPKYANDIYLNNAIRYLKEIKAPSLNDDQQVVLESLKHYYSKSNYYDIRAGKEPMQAVDRMLMEAESDTTGLSDVYYGLTEKQQFQVLAAFAEWGMSND